MSEAPVDPKTIALRRECQAQFQNAGYTALSFTIWLRFLRWVKIFALTTPVIFAALATKAIVSNNAPVMAAVFALLAAIIPPTFQAGELGASIRKYTRMAGEFTNLRDRFRQLEEVYSLKPYAEFEAAFQKTFARMENARAKALSPPEWTFRCAQTKWKQGHYEPDPTPTKGMSDDRKQGT